MKGFQARCTAADTGVVAGGGAPAWFGPALAAGLAGIRADIADIRGDIAEIRGDIANLTARQRNAVAVHQTDQLIPLNNGAGNSDPNFPPTIYALNSMNGPRLTTSLTFYGQPAGGAVEARRDRFKKFVGIRL
mmetsp:Transcript_37973/g.78898  ORF Transcript_37973/g.78898 Transcript_37973/m.78898 type:complete len:133 (-) Transcript_37973:243-641(-)